MSQSERKMLLGELDRVRDQLDDIDERTRIAFDMIEWQNGIILQQDLQIVELERKMPDGGQSTRCDPQTCTYVK